MAYDLSAIRKARQTYKTSMSGMQPAPASRQFSKSNVTNAAQKMASNTPAVPRTEQTLSNIQSAVNKPFQFNADTDQGYQAALRAAQQNLQVSQKNTNAQLRASGQGKSSYSETVANQLANQSNENIANNILPQYVQQAYQQYQDGISNQSNLYGLQYQQDVTTPQNEAQITGNYVPPAAKSAIDNLLQLKQQAETKGITAADRSALSQQADGIRAQLQAMGIDPAKYGANVNAAQASAINPGIRTLAGQSQDFGQATTTRQLNTADKQYSEEMAYKKSRDAITDKQWQQTFDQNVTQNGLDYALRALSQQDDASYRQAQLALSQDDNARQWASLETKTETAATKAAKNTDTYEKYQSNIEKIADRDSKTGVLKNPDAVKTYISQSPMSSYEKYRAWVSSGLEWPSNVAVPQPGE